MKKTLLILAFLISLQIKAQEDKTVTLTVSGNGKTIEEAKTNALRSAIEQAFGAFISSKTEILNDNLVKDEIVSVANGNIQKFDIISQVEIPNNGYAMTLNATVSISKLTSFAESKGIAVEFKGGLFAQNIKLQKLNEDAEEKAIKNLIEVYIQLLENSFDYTLESSEPVLVPGKSDTYEIKFLVKTIENENYNNFIKYFKETLSNVQANEEEASNVLKVGKPIYTLVVDSKEYKFRSKNGFRYISKFFISTQLLSSAFKIESNIGQYKYSFNKLFIGLNKRKSDLSKIMLNSYTLPFKNNEYEIPVHLASLFPLLVNDIKHKSISDFYQIDVEPVVINKNAKLGSYRENFVAWAHLSTYYYNSNFERDLTLSSPLDLDNTIYFKTIFNPVFFSFDRNFTLSELETINEFKIQKIPFLEYINNISNYVELKEK